jgi:hypothetical protein
MYRGQPLPSYGMEGALLLGQTWCLSIREEDLEGGLKGGCILVEAAGFCCYCFLANLEAGLEEVDIAAECLLCQSSLAGDLAGAGTGCCFLSSREEVRGEVYTSRGWRS